MSITPLFTSRWNFDKIHPPSLEKMTLVSAAIICFIAKVLEEEAAVVFISSNADYSGLLSLIVLRFDTNEDPSSLHVPMKFWQDPSTDLEENGIDVHRRKLSFEKSMMIHIIESEGALVIGRGLYLVVVAVYCIDTTQKSRFLIGALQNMTSTENDTVRMSF